MLALYTSHFSGAHFHIRNNSYDLYIALFVISCLWPGLSEGSIFNKIIRGRSNIFAVLILYLKDPYLLDIPCALYERPFLRRLCNTLLYIADPVITVFISVPIAF